VALVATLALLAGRALLLAAPLGLLTIAALFLAVALALLSAFPLALATRIATAALGLGRRGGCSRLGCRGGRFRAAEPAENTIDDARTRHFGGRPGRTGGVRRRLLGRDAPDGRLRSGRTLF